MTISMSNVITLQDYMPMYQLKKMRIVEPQKRSINFSLIAWFRKIAANYKKHQDDLKNKKIKALEKAAYQYYLDYYLTRTKGTVDIHESLYRSGYAVCKFAEDMAVIQVMKVVNEGRLDECYKALKKYNKKRKNWCSTKH